MEFIFTHCDTCINMVIMCFTIISSPIVIHVATRNKKKTPHHHKKLNNGKHVN